MRIRLTNFSETLQLDRRVISGSLSGILKVKLMKARALALLSAAIVAILFTCSAFAHHSLSAEFDLRRRIPLAGTVTKVEWANPHTFFYVDVKDPKTGDTLTWACELGSANMLHSLGWTRATLKAGMTVSLTGSVARDGTRKVNARNIVADGNRLAAWPSEQGAVNP